MHKFSLLKSCKNENQKYFFSFFVKINKTISFHKFFLKLKSCFSFNEIRKKPRTILSKLKKSENQTITKILLSGIPSSMFQQLVPRVILFVFEFSNGARFTASWTQHTHTHTVSRSFRQTLPGVLNATHARESHQRWRKRHRLTNIQVQGIRAISAKQRKKKDEIKGGR